MTKLNEDGTVFYEIIDSVLKQDSVIFWTIKEKLNIYVKYEWLGGADSGWVNTESLHFLKETLSANHTLQNDSMRVWEFFYSCDPKPTRYYNSNAQTVSFQTSFYPLFYVNYTFQKNLGLTKYNYSNGGSGMGFHWNDIKNCELISSHIMNAEKGNGVVSEFLLEQNYPNPFNPTTTIRYVLPSSKQVNGTGLRAVSLILYDILGNEVTTLVNKQQQPGKYQTIFDGSRLSSGVYFYTLSATNETGSFSSAKKFVLLK
ncbi:MAG: T9SS type A sorting domain-containing protein [Ignavibacteriaceae bacterium]|nr:T9SS type A sorting domain-containing protein [Ignavibacteriaceae bacterium]